MNHGESPSVSLRMVETRAALASDEGVRAVYAAHGPELYRFALRSLGDRGLAEEAVQETFVRAWQAADRFDDALGSLRTWLFAIVRNVVIDLRARVRSTAGRGAARRAGHDRARRRDRQRARRVAGRGGAAEAERRAPQPRSSRCTTRAAPYHEVAGELGVPVGTVKSRVYYALQGDASRARRVGLVR